MRSYRYHVASLAFNWGLGPHSTFVFSSPCKYPQRGRVLSATPGVGPYWASLGPPHPLPPHTPASNEKVIGPDTCQHRTLKSNLPARHTGFFGLGDGIIWN